MNKIVLSIIFFSFITILSIPSAEGAWCDSSYSNNRVINITNQNTTHNMTTGQVVIDVFDTTGADFQDDGDDVRILYTEDNGTTCNDLHRVNITSFNSATTWVAWKLNNTIEAGTYNDTSYWLYYNNSAATSPNENIHTVFGKNADNFDNDINA
ncbi:MAG: hypothetical protein JSW41_02070, partial [Candidatus Aenigmatarchaeota archaeon]